MTCEACERFPVGNFNGQPLCANHIEQWVATETRHAPILSDPAPAMPRGTRQQGVTSHTPRHYK